MCKKVGRHVGEILINASAIIIPILVTILPLFLKRAYPDNIILRELTFTSLVTFYISIVAVLVALYAFSLGKKRQWWDSFHAVMEGISSGNEARVAVGWVQLEKILEDINVTDRCFGGVKEPHLAREAAVKAIEVFLENQNEHADGRVKSLQLRLQELNPSYTLNENTDTRVEQTPGAKDEPKVGECPEMRSGKRKGLHWKLSVRWN